MALAALPDRLAAAPPRVKALAAAALLAVIALAAAAFVLTRDTRTPLFAAPLMPDQLAEVEARLAAWNVAYAPAPGNVRVDRGRRGDLLLRLSLAGVPRTHLAGSGETLAHAGAMTPQSVLDAQARDGLAADLALGLRGLAGVADARVVIAPASGGVYVDDDAHAASASVRIALQPGAHLAPRAVAGIKAFVAGGVAGLEPERVNVVDDRGLVIASERGADADAESVQNALQSALDAAFGAGTTVVRVHRDVVSERRDVHDVRRAPLGGAIARSSTDERFAGDRKRYSKANAVEDRGSDTHEERRTALPGAAGRVSVAVLVDAARRLDLEKIRSVAAAASGADTGRGDRVSVEAVPFAGTAAPAPPKHDVWLFAGAFAGVLPQAIVAAAFACALFFGARPACAAAIRALESANVRAAARDVAGVPPQRVRGALAGEPPHIAAAIISALPAATATAVLDLYPPEERAAIVRRLSRAASPLVPDAEELLRVRG